MSGYACKIKKKMGKNLNNGICIRNFRENFEKLK
jgi:hypothetical protein